MNDTMALMQLLSSKSNIMDLFTTIQGPWAFVFFNVQIECKFNA